MTLLARLDWSALRAALRRRAERVTPAAPAPGQFVPPLKVRLLVLQATPFCNIDCAYCYLPHRDVTARMPLTVVEAAVRSVIECGLVGERLSIAWHAGEPLAAGIDFYRRAFACIDEVIAGRVAVRHSIQTNATLIDQAWCELFARRDVKVGVSVDGPAAVHDCHRKARDGRGTHARAMRGVRQLLRNGLPFHAIAVVTPAALQRADEIFDFFLAEGFTEVGFNVDELEGERRRSSLGAEHEAGYRRFLQRMLERSEAAAGRLRIREIEEARKVILHGLDAVEVGHRRCPSNAQVLPLAILSVDHAGNCSTFSPELIGQRCPEYGDFVFGNVLDDPVDAIFANPAFQRAYGQIVAGVERCRRECEFFDLCGGGAPANKFYENGSFASAETAYCRNVVMAPLRMMLADLEQRVPG